MKVFVVLFCLLVAVLALPAAVENKDTIESDRVSIEAPSDDLVEAESAHHGGYGRYGGRGGWGGGYGRGYGYGGYGGGYGRYGGYGRGHYGGWGR